MCKSLLNHKLDTRTVYILLTIVPKRAYKLSKFHVKYVENIFSSYKTIVHFSLKIMQVVKLPIHAI